MGRIALDYCDKFIYLDISFCVVVLWFQLLSKVFLYKTLLNKNDLLRGKSSVRGRQVRARLTSDHSMWRAPP